MIQFTQPIHDTPIGPIVVLPPNEYTEPGGFKLTSNELIAVGDVAEVVELPPDCPAGCTVHGWRRVGFVKVVEVLPIIDPTVTLPGLRSHVTVADDDVLLWEWDDAVEDFICHELDLPTAEPGGLAVLVERIECPEPLCWQGQLNERGRSGDGIYLGPCPTCTTPPEVTT